MTSLLLLQACGANLQISDTCTCGYYTDQNGTEYHWPDGTQLKYVVHSSFPESLRPALTAAAETHNSVLASTQISIDTTSNSAPNYDTSNPQSVSGDGVNGIYFLPEPWPWANTEANSDAMTVVLFSNGQIVEADIFFRAEKFQDSSTTTASNASAVSPFKDLSQGLGLTHQFDVALTPDASAMASDPNNEQWVYVIGKHELGHGLGWVHTDEDSIMQPSVQLSYVYESFSSIDIERAQRHYSITSAAVSAE